MSKRAIAGTLLFGAALVFTGDRSRVTADEEYEQVADDSRSLRELDARVDRSVLAVETGLVLNYDPLTASLRAMREKLDRIERTQLVKRDPNIAALVRRVHAHVLDEESRVESFEAEFSVFRNSLSYLPIAGRAAVADTIDSPLDDEVDAEIAAILSQALCRSECTPAMLEEFARTIAALEATRDRLPPDLRASVELTLRHARVFLEYSPRVDAAVDGVLEADDTSYDLLFDAVQNAHADAEARAARYRWTFVALVAAICAWVAFSLVRLRLKTTRLALAVEHEAAAKRMGEERRVELANSNKLLETRVAERTRELVKTNEQ
ncbi:MAG TPA: DAHL domain-containing protein, partial [Polyangiaceae bacterium]